LKKLLLTTQFFLFIAFNFFLLMAGYQLFTSSDTMQRPGYSEPVYNHKEEFDPSLSRLNSLEKLSAYCDSIYSNFRGTSQTSFPEASYTEIASSVIRKRFYHGYSLYGMNKNFMAMVLSKMSLSGLSAIVIPDDILKYPYAACSQQSIVLMKLLQSRGYPTRSVAFSGTATGHFSFETYYDGNWHYNDPNKEPDINVLKAYNIPSIAFLNKNPDVLLKAYPQYSKEYVLDVFTKYSYGSVNTFPAPKAIIFQNVSKFLSYTMWSFFLLAFILVRRKYKGLKNSVALKTSSKRVVVHTPTPISSVYSPA
jgi:hypothetical protein